MVRPGPEEHLGHRAGRDRDAVRGGRRRRRARGAAGRGAHHDLHGLAGPAADDPQHVQDRRRADGVHHARRRAHRRDARAVDLRRPLGRDGLPPDRLRDARLGLGPGGPRLRRDRPRRDARGARPVPALLRRLPDLARGAQDRAADRRRPALPGARRDGRRAPPARAQPRPPGAARHRAEPGRLLPGARGLQPLLRRAAGDRREDDGPLRRAHRPPLPPVRLRRPPAGRARDRADGLGGRGRPRDRRAPGRPGEKVGILKVRLYRPFSIKHFAPRCPRACARSRCSTAPRSRARSASRSTSTW